MASHTGRIRGNLQFKAEPKAVRVRGSGYSTAPGCVLAVILFIIMLAVLAWVRSLGGI